MKSVIKKPIPNPNRLAITANPTIYSPAWVIEHPKNTLAYNLELINRIKKGVKKQEWKQFIANLEVTEDGLVKILPTSLSSMQKRSVYDIETSERIYELARLFGLGYKVFNSKPAFKNWLLTPLKTLKNKKPLELLDCSLGFKLVENEIAKHK